MEKNLNHEKRENISENPLTRIRETYTLSPTPKDTGDVGEGEVDDLMVKQFISALAEVALAIAVRRVNHNGDPQ